MQTDEVNKMKFFMLRTFFYALDLMKKNLRAARKERKCFVRGNSIAHMRAKKIIWNVVARFDTCDWHWFPFIFSFQSQAPNRISAFHQNLSVACSNANYLHQLDDIFCSRRQRWVIDWSVMGLFSFFLFFLIAQLQTTLDWHMKGFSL